MSGKQQKAIGCLLTCRSIVEASKCAGVNERTLRRWLADRDFSAALRRARQQAFDVVVSRVASIALEAVEFLAKVIQDTAAPVSVRVRAALGILSNASTLHDADIQTRLDEIEARLEEIISDAETGSG